MKVNQQKEHSTGYRAARNLTIHGNELGLPCFRFAGIEVTLADRPNVENKQQLLLINLSPIDADLSI